MRREDFRNGHAGGRLDLVVGIDERQGRAVAARRRPTEVLPAPIMPTSTTERLAERCHDRGSAEPALLEGSGMRSGHGELSTRRKIQLRSCGHRPTRYDLLSGRSERGARWSAMVRAS